MSKQALGGIPPSFGLVVEVHVAQLHTMVHVHVPLSAKPLSDP